MKKQIPITLLILILCAAPGCSRFRKLTRREYTTLSDPFVDKSTLTADVAATAPAASGIARLNGTPPTTSGNAQTVPSTALASAPSTASGTPPTSKPTGPALSDFVGQTPQTASLSQTRPPSQAVPVSSSSPVSDTEMARISGQFPQPQSNSNPATNVIRDSGFAEWANSRKNEWEKQVSEAESVGNAAATAGIQQVSQTVSQAADQAFGELPEPVQAMVQHRESATPLITQQPVTQQPVAAGNLHQAEVDAFGDFAAQAGATSATASSAPPMRAAFSDPAPAAHATTANTAPSPAVAPSPPPAFANRTRLPGTRVTTSPSNDAWPAAAAQAVPTATAPRPSDPFAAFATAPISQPSANTSPDPFDDADPFAEAIPASPGMRTLDSGFSFDSGWKPSHLQRP